MYRQDERNVTFPPDPADLAARDRSPWSQARLAEAAAAGPAARRPGTGVGRGGGAGGAVLLARLGWADPWWGQVIRAERSKRILTKGLDLHERSGLEGY